APLPAPGPSPVARCGRRGRTSPDSWSALAPKAALIWMMRDHASSRLQPRGKLLEDLVAEERDPLRDQARRRVHQMKRCPSRSMPRQDATEIGVVPAGAGDDREQREALPRRRRLADHVVIVRVDRAPPLDHLRAARTDELPDRPPRRATEQHALVLRERRDRARGAASLEVP